MVTILGPTPQPQSPPPPPVEPVVDPQLAALRAFRDDVLRVRSEPGHITKAEVDEILARYEQRMRA